MLKLKIINKPKMIKMKCNIEFPDVVLANMQEKEITPTKETQIVEPDKNYDGLKKVTVNKIPDDYIIPTGEIQINQNGIYNVKDKVTANVNIPEKQLGTKTITTNGTYKAVDDNLDGYSEVEVATSGVDINDYFETTYSGTSSNDWVIKNFIKKIPDVIIDDSVTSLEQFCANCNYAPKIICNSNINNMLTMYYYNKSSNIDTSGLNTSGVTNMARMFENCNNLTSLDVSNFNTSKVTDMGNMFYYCNKLTSLDLRNFDFSNVTSYNNMFKRVNAGCLIIVKDDTAKTWITSKFTALTNVKTVAELEQ